MGGIIDLFMIYQFIRRLVTPFEKWKAFEYDIIDKDGNVLRKRRELRTPEEKKAFGIFDVMVLNMKKLLAKIPGGSTRLGTYASALFLIREWKNLNNENLLIEDIFQNELENSFYDRYVNYIKEQLDVNQEMNEIVNNVGFGDIAGLGVGLNGEPGLSKKQQKKYRNKNISPNRPRKSFSAFIKGEDL